MRAGERQFAQPAGIHHRETQKKITAQLMKLLNAPGTPPPPHPPVSPPTYNHQHSYLAEAPQVEVQTRGNDWMAA